jgi:hypothetical protein
VLALHPPICSTLQARFVNVEHSGKIQIINYPQGFVITNNQNFRLDSKSILLNNIGTAFYIKSGTGNSHITCSDLRASNITTTLIECEAGLTEYNSESIVLNSTYPTQMLLVNNSASLNTDINYNIEYFWGSKI